MKIVQPVDVRRMVLVRVIAALLLAATALALRAQPVLFHDHGHGLSYSSDGKALLAPSHGGLAVYEDGVWWEASGPIQGFSGFSVAERGIYASGHARPGIPSAHEPVGLIRSTDGGRTWQPLAPVLAGKADFRLLAAGYRSNAIYVVNARPNPAMSAPGIYVTHDDGNTWRRVAAGKLEGEIHGLAAHPREAGPVAVATGRGPHLSRAAGDNFVRIDGKEPTAVAFDLDGARGAMRDAVELVVESSLDGQGRRALRLPPLKLDYVTCLAQNEARASARVATPSPRLHDRRRRASRRRITAEEARQGVPGSDRVIDDHKGASGGPRPTRIRQGEVLMMATDGCGMQADERTAAGSVFEGKLFFARGLQKNRQSIRLCGRAAAGCQRNGGHALTGTAKNRTPTPINRRWCGADGGDLHVPDAS